MIIQSTAQDGKNTISFTVPQGDLNKALATLEPVKTELRPGRMHEAGVGKVAVVGVGMRSHPGVAARMSRRWPTRRSTSR